MKKGHVCIVLLLGVSLLFLAVSDADAAKRKRRVPRASKTYSEGLAKHNAVADRCGIERVKTISRINEFVQGGYFIPVPEETPYYQNVTVPEFRYLLPVAKDFLEEMAGAFFSKFKTRLKITEMLRDGPYQTRLVRSRTHGASSNAHCSVPSQCTLHFTGLAFDVSKRDSDRRLMSWQQLRWMFDFLGKAEREEKISFFPEYSNFHVTVHPRCPEQSFIPLPRKPRA